MNIVTTKNMTSEKNSILITFANERHAKVLYCTNGGLRIECPSWKVEREIRKKLKELKKK